MADKAEMQRMCANCAAWQPPRGPGTTMGECRLHPPKPFMILGAAPGASRLSVADPRQQTQQVQPMFLSSWAAAPAEGWCYEWQEQGK
jgi:hypothetical protein